MKRNSLNTEFGGKSRQVVVQDSSLAAADCSRKPLPDVPQARRPTASRVGQPTEPAQSTAILDRIREPVPGRVSQPAQPTAILESDSDVSRK
jgi:hypothetical protein